MGSLRPLGTGRALTALNSLNADALGSLSSFGSLSALHALWTATALHTLRALWSSLADRALRTLGTLSPLCTSRTLDLPDIVPVRCDDTGARAVKHMSMTVVGGDPQITDHMGRR